MRIVMMAGLAALLLGCTVRAVDEDCVERAKKACGLDDACTGREEALCPDADGTPPDDG